MTLVIFGGQRKAPGGRSLAGAVGRLEEVGLGPDALEPVALAVATGAIVLEDWADAGSAALALVEAIAATFGHGHLQSEQTAEGAKDIELKHGWSPA